MGFKNLFNRKKSNNGVMLTQIEAEFEQVFKKFDVNGDGKISSSEHGSIMGSLGHRPNDDELEIMIKELDSGGDGFIDLKGFVELNTKDVDSSEVLENLRDAFSVFDVDTNGLISAEELQKVLGRLGEECTVAEYKLSNIVVSMYTYCEIGST